MLKAAHPRWPRPRTPAAPLLPRPMTSRSPLRMPCRARSHGGSGRDAGLCVCDRADRTAVPLALGREGIRAGDGTRGDGRPDGSAGAACGAFGAPEPLPRAAAVLGADDRGPGHLHPAAARPGGSRAADRSPARDAAPDRRRCRGGLQRTDRAAGAVQRADGAARGSSARSTPSTSIR